MPSTDVAQPCVLLCVTGCIAAYKACEVLRDLQRAGCRVKVLMSEHATHFVGPTTFRALTHEKVAVGLFDDPEDPIHHISLAQEADVVLVAPATANVMAKMACGIADDLLSTTLLATPAPIVVAPAMNVGMWDAAATQENIATLKRRGVAFVEPGEGYLACGDVAKGRLADPSDIAAYTLQVLDSQNTARHSAAIDTSEDQTLLAGEHVLITAGPTHEPIDPVRYISNRSSGKMGIALAQAAKGMGAEVTLVLGPTELSAPEGVSCIPVETAAEMHDAALAAFDEATMAICAAAVADYTPLHPADHKLKKDHEHLERIELVETKDILAELSATKGDRVVVGFAAETDDLIAHAAAKRERKGCDAIVANDVSCADSTFGSDTDHVFWITQDGVEELPLMTKPDVARAILSRAARLHE